MLHHLPPFPVRGVCHPTEGAVATPSSEIEPDRSARDALCHWAKHEFAEIHSFFLPDHHFLSRGRWFSPTVVSGRTREGRESRARIPSTGLRTANQNGMSQLESVMTSDFVLVMFFSSLVVCHSWKPQSVQRVRVKTPGHTQAVVALITCNGPTSFRAEDAVDFSPVITLSR